MDPDAQLLLTLDLYIHNGAVGQVILEHHVNPVASGERIFNMRNGLVRV